MNTSDQISGSQFLSFILREEHFAVEIFKVREVLDVTTLTRIPKMPDYMCGVINLRGNVVPVVDLGLKLGMNPYVKTVNTCIMIVDIKSGENSESIHMGILSDGVQEVIDLSEQEIEPAPKMGSGLATDFIRGMGRKNDQFLILLDIDSVLATDDQNTIGNFSNEQKGELPTVTESDNNGVEAQAA